VICVVPVGTVGASAFFVHAIDSLEGKISSRDLHFTLETLRHEVQKFEVEDMIWEVDEDLDHMVSWEEFRLMYQRVRTDKTGLEARKLYNVVDFVMHDNDVDGYVTLDECFAIMFMRHGKNFGEEDIKKLFASANSASAGHGNRVSYDDFLRFIKEQNNEKIQKFINRKNGKAEKA
jgi:Ca2+-binding EF-hand superfamily protein